MNSAKAIIKGESKKKEKKTVKGPDPKKNIILAGIIIVVAALICILIGVEQLSRKTVLTVDKQKLYFDEMMYYVYQTEVDSSYMDQLYQQLNGTSYYDMTAEDGTSNQETIKADIQAAMIEDQILYDQAQKAGYSLTEEERAKAAEEGAGIMSQLTSKQKTATKITKKNLGKLLERIALADRYKQDLIDGFDIDDEAIKAGVDAEAFRQYDVEYYFAATQTAGEDGTQTQLGEEEKKALLEEMNTLHEKASKAEDFKTLIAEGEETKITFQEKGFKAGDGTFEEDLQEQLIAMENNGLTDVMERADGYYFFKMVNNNSTEAYDAEVSSQIEEKENEAYSEKYMELFNQYTVMVKESIWNNLKIGQLLS